MDTQREIRTSTRNRGFGSVQSAASATAMEVKRKKILQSSLFQQTQNTNLQAKLDFEVRMREGAYKLLLACSKREQVLNASKNLLTCNARIRAYLHELQETKEEEEEEVMGAHGRQTDSVSVDRVPCTGKVALSGLRFPLMWRDSDHFNNRGSSRRMALFCMMHLGSEVFDTEMVVVDRSVTDVCFEGVIIFQDAVPSFELRVELWSCVFEEELTMAKTPKKLAKKLRNSFGKSGGKKLCPLLDTSDPDTFLQCHPIPSGARYNLLAYTTLGLCEAEGSFQSHSLIILQNAEWPTWLPLYGNLCCKLVAQPVCMTQHMMAGYLSQKQTVLGMNRSCSLYCVLSGGFLSCYFTPEEIDAKVEPTLRVPVTKNTHICVLEKEWAGQRSRSLSITSPSAGGSESHVFSTGSGEELDDWLEAFHQHLFDQGQWLHCCEQLMKMEVKSPPKPSLFLTKEADCVYNDLSINSPCRFDSVTDIIHNKIEESDGLFLIGRQEKQEPPNWSTLFDGSQSVLVQKTIHSQSQTSTPCPSPVTGAKKRPAPPPPLHKAPYTPPPRPARPPPPVPPPEKENSCTVTSRSSSRSKTGRPSLDAKFSAIIQQLQRNGTTGAGALARRNAPLAVLHTQPHGQAAGPPPPPPPPPPPQLELQNQQIQTTEPRAEHASKGAGSGPSPAPGPVPAPRSRLRKSFRDRMNLKVL